MAGTKPLRADAQRNRKALLSAAREVFEAGDFDLRFDEFARRAGVGIGTLYRHFPTREALVEAVYREEVTNLCDQARELQAALPPAEALASFLRGMVGHLDAHRGLGRTLAALLSTGSGALAEGSRALEDAVTSLVVAAVADGTVRGDADAGSVMVALHGIGAAHERDRWRTEADGLVTLVLDGLRPARLAGGQPDQEQQGQRHPSVPRTSGPCSPCPP